MKKGGRCPPLDTSPRSDEARFRRCRALFIGMVKRHAIRRKTCSGFGSRTPQRSRLLAPLRLKRPPKLLCSVFPQISTLLEQRWTSGHLTPPIDKDLGVSDPGGIVSMKTPDPMVVGINQPSLSHHATSGHQPISASLRTIQLRHLFVRCSPCGT